MNTLRRAAVALVVVTVTADRAWLTGTGRRADIRARVADETKVAQRRRSGAARANAARRRAIVDDGRLRTDGGADGAVGDAREHTRARLLRRALLAERARRRRRRRWTRRASDEQAAFDERAGRELTLQRRWALLASQARAVDLACRLGDLTDVVDAVGGGALAVARRWRRTSTSDADLIGRASRRAARAADAHARAAHGATCARRRRTAAASARRLTETLTADEIARAAAVEAATALLRAGRDVDAERVDAIAALVERRRHDWTPPVVGATRRDASGAARRGARLAVKRIALLAWIERIGSTRANALAANHAACALWRAEIDVHALVADARIFGAVIAIVARIGPLRRAARPVANLAL